MKFRLDCNYTEFLIAIIRKNCNNIDDLSKISVAIESMIEALKEPIQPTILRQLLLQVGEKVE